MQLADVLEAVRAHYLRTYRAAIAPYRERNSPGGPEVLLEVPGERPIPYSYYRIDLASGAVSPPNLTDVNPNSHLEFAEIEQEYDGLTLLLQPMVWNSIEFDTSPALADDTAIREWALIWLDPDDTNARDEDGLGGCIHSITTPDVIEAGSTFAVDFGSAPTESVVGLLSVLRSLKVRSVILHSRSVLAENE